MSDQREERATFYLAVIAAVAIVAASVWVVVLLSDVTPMAAVWLSAMIALGTIAVYASRKRRAAILWVAAGGVCGFALLGSASIGLLFSPGGLILLTAALTTTPWTNVWGNLWNAVWFVWGGSGVSAMSVLIAWQNSYRFVAPDYHVEPTEVPPTIVLLGAEVFVAASVLLLMRLLLRFRAHRYGTTRLKHS